MTSDINILASKMLENSYIYKVGLIGSFPSITFLNKDSSVCTTLRIDSTLAIFPLIRLPYEISNEHKESIILLDLDAEVFDSLSIAGNGDLTIIFSSGRKILVEGLPNDSEIYEPWVLFNETTKDQLICLYGGDACFTKGN